MTASTDSSRHGLKHRPPLTHLGLSVLFFAFAIYQGVEARLDMIASRREARALATVTKIEPLLGARYEFTVGTWRYFGHISHVTPLPPPGTQLPLYYDPHDPWRHDQEPLERGVAGRVGAAVFLLLLAAGPAADVFARRRKFPAARAADL